MESYLIIGCDMVCRDGLWNSLQGGSHTGWHDHSILRTLETHGYQGIPQPTPEMDKIRKLELEYNQVK